MNHLAIIRSRLRKLEEAWAEVPAGKTLDACFELIVNSTLPQKGDKLVDGNAMVCKMLDVPESAQTVNSGSTQTFTSGGTVVYEKRENGAHMQLTVNPTPSEQVSAPEEKWPAECELRITGYVPNPKFVAATIEDDLKAAVRFPRRVSVYRGQRNWKTNEVVRARLARGGVSPVYEMVRKPV